MSLHNPEDRPDSSQVLEHEFVDDSALSPESIQQEIIDAFKKLEEVFGNDMDPFSDEIPGTHRVNDEFDPEREEWVRHDDEQFNKLRNSLISEVSRINKALRKRRL